MNDFPLEAHNVATAPTTETRPLYWSVRRELWDNRSLYMAPVLVALLILFASTVSAIWVPHRRAAILKSPEAQQRIAIAAPYDQSAMMLLATMFVVGFFYSIDALHSERRDRSILFWKSLPVSDATTVLAKVSIPLVVLPAICCGVVLIMHGIMAVVTNLVLLLSGFDPGTVFRQLSYIPSPHVLIYGLVVIALSHAPLHAWLLLVSAWARRVPILWAFLPFVSLSILEHIIFHTTYVPKLFGFVLGGGIERAFIFSKQHYVEPQLTPGRFLLSPGLWLGLIAAALLLTAAIRLRRHREPIS